MRLSDTVKGAAASGLGTVQTFPSPMDTGQALPRVSELTVRGGPGVEGPQPAWDSGALAWVGRVEGFLEEVWHASGR